MLTHHDVCLCSREEEPTSTKRNSITSTT